jgi:hypothetical protein
MKTLSALVAGVLACLAAAGGQAVAPHNALTPLVGKRSSRYMLEVGWVMSVRLATRRLTQNNLCRNILAATSNAHEMDEIAPAATIMNRSAVELKHVEDMGSRL